MKARIQFTKTGAMKFIGHLDLMRYFQKLLVRSGMDVAYSKGYNPHPILSFASPLGVGLTSEGEYLDLELNALGKDTPDGWVGRMNEESNEEIRIRKMVRLNDAAKPSMAVLAAADYLISIKEGHRVCEDLKERFFNFLSLDRIPYVRKTKKGENEIDLKKYVYDRMENPDGEGFSYLRLAAGSVMNGKPEWLLEAFCGEYGITYQPYAYQVHRMEMYSKGTHNWISLSDTDVAQACDLNHDASMDGDGV